MDVKALAAAISLASQLRPKTAMAKLMLTSAKLVKRLREALQEGDFNEASQVLESVKGKQLATDAIGEIRLAQDAVDNWVRCGVGVGVVLLCCGSGALPQCLLTVRALVRCACPRVTFFPLVVCARVCHD